jgi:chemotaxis protein CheD
MIQYRAKPQPLTASLAAEHRIHIIQGEFHVSDDPNVVLTTLLGSCVSACLRDPYAKVGGMNHFLLPGPEDGSSHQAAERYGVHLMELLVNGLLQHGAARERVEAKLFGGARTMRGLSDVGALNASFAERFLKNEGIKLVGSSLRGDLGRRIQFWPVSGRARQIYLKPGELPPPRRILDAPERASSGSVELF